MRSLCALLIFCSAFAARSVEKSERVELQGDLKLPENYVQQKQIFDQQDLLIPMEASQTTSPGAFGGKILEYHLADIIQNNQFKALEGMKSLENAVNRNTEVSGPGFKMKSKLDLNRMRAEMNIESFITTKVWTEDSFKTLRGQMKLYDIENGLVSIENRSNHQDTRTYLNIEKTW